MLYEPQLQLSKPLCRILLLKIRPFQDLFLKMRRFKIETSFNRQLARIPDEVAVELGEVLGEVSNPPIFGDRKAQLP